MKDIAEYLTLTNHPSVYRSKSPFYRGMNPDRFLWDHSRWWKIKPKYGFGSGIKLMTSAPYYQGEPRHVVDAAREVIAQQRGLTTFRVSWAYEMDDSFQLCFVKTEDLKDPKFNEFVERLKRPDLRSSDWWRTMQIPVEELEEKSCST